MARTDVAVVGAGPAGMAAALAAAEAGAQVTLIEEFGRPGGQYFRHAADAFALAGPELSREHGQGEELRRALRHPSIALLTATLVWGAFEGNQLMICGADRSEALHAKAIVLATGAYDRPVAFPGWTLPGVMTAGGAQAMAKAHWVKPGERILLSGAGPFLLPVARQLLRAGAEIVAITEATAPNEWLRHAPALWGQWPRFAEAWDYWRALRRARVPVLYRHKVVHALGDGAVAAARIAKVDSSWRTVAGTERSLEVDAIATGYGFLPNIELAEIFGCELRWDPFGQSWFVACDANLATNRSGIFAAGEITGIGGSAIALEEGKIAGIGAAEYAGAIGRSEADTRRHVPLRQRARLAIFANMLNELFRPRPGLWEGFVGDTTICRCEEVSAAEIRICVRNGCATPKAVKDLCRVGMGLCQGRICRAAVTQIIAEETGHAISDIPRAHVRPPIKPVPLGVVAVSEEPHRAEAAL